MAKNPTDFERETAREIAEDAGKGHKVKVKVKRKGGGAARGYAAGGRLDHARRQAGGIAPGAMPMAAGVRAPMVRPGMGGVPAGMPASAPGAVMPTRVMPRPPGAAAPALMGPAARRPGMARGGKTGAPYPDKPISPLGDEDTNELDRSRGNFTNESKKPRDNYKDGGSSNNWIKGAVQHPGRETRAAKRAGESTHEYMEEHKDSPGSSGKAARLGLRLSAMNK